MLAELPLSLGLLLSSAAGLVAGAFVNWAAYSLAWNRRPVSPWSAAHPDAAARRASDRLPLWGWFGLRRESSVHGRGFWIRPLVVEVAMAAALAALYWWEVDRQGLIVGQFDAIAPGTPLRAAAGATLATFLSHALLVTLMAAASLIDVDEKTIPDGITVPGTLLALLIAAVEPSSLLPHATGEMVPMPADLGDALILKVEPLSLASPNAWPDALSGAPQWLSLAIGLACFATWCFALTPRILRARRGLRIGLRVLLARIARELSRPPLLWIGLGGGIAIVGVWFAGGPNWVGLLTSLVGMIGGGAMVWAVRIVGKWALRKEAMGFGDVTLMMMIGAFLGWQSGIFIFFIAPFAGLIVGILQMALRRDDVIPYGPFLCLGALVVMVRWADFWNADPGSLQAFFDFPWLVPGILAVGVVMLGAMLVVWRNIKEAIFGVPVEE